MSFYISITEDRNWPSNHLTAHEGTQIDHKKASFRKTAYLCLLLSFLFILQNKAVYTCTCLLMNVTTLKDHIRSKASSYFVVGSYTGRGSNHNRVKGTHSFMSSKSAMLVGTQCTYRNPLLPLHRALQHTHGTSRAPAPRPHQQNALEGPHPQGKVPK